MVTLSGGDLGGSQVDGTGWAVDAKKTITQDGKTYVYRRVVGDQAVFLSVS